MRIPWDEGLEDTLKAVEQSAIQWPRVEIMIDFCLTGDSPGPQLGIKARRRANTLPWSVFLIQVGTECSRSLMIDSRPLVPFSKEKQYLMKLCGCIFWHVACSLESGVHPSALSVAWRYLTGHTGLRATQPGVSADICLGSSPASPRVDLCFSRYRGYESQGWRKCGVPPKGG